MFKRSTRYLKNVSKTTKIYLLLLSLLLLYYCIRHCIDCSEHPDVFETNWAELEDDGYLDNWQYIGDPVHRYQIYSAYYDARIHVSDVELAPGALGCIRIIAIFINTTQFENVHCNYRYDVSVWKNYITPLRVNRIREHQDMNFSAFFVVCPIVLHTINDHTKWPEAVGLTVNTISSMHNVTSVTKIHYPRRQFKKSNNKLAVCIGPVHFNYSDALRIVEFVEIYRILGVSKFYFYNDSISLDVDSVFRYYKNIGIAHILGWKFKDFVWEKEIRYEGQFATLNDCVYRATILDNYKYIAIVDFDEIMIPFNEDNLTEFLRKNDRIYLNSFVFRNTFFLNTNKSNHSVAPIDAVNKMLYTQMRYQRKAYIYPVETRSKYIVKGAYAIEIGCHVLGTGIPFTSYYEVPVADGLLFHYRETCPDSDCELVKLKIDKRANKFRDTIWQRVDKTCAEVFSNGICPLK